MLCNAKTKKWQFITLTHKNTTMHDTEFRSCRNIYIIQLKYPDFALSSLNDLEALNERAASNVLASSTSS